MKNRLTRKPRIIGPFFVLAIMLSAAVFVWQKRQTEHEVAVAPPPVVEHQVQAGAGPETTAVPPPDLVWKNAARLKLTERHKQRLEPVVTAYEKQAAPLRQRLDVASREFSASQRRPNVRKPVEFAELQQQMAVVSALSGEMAALRVQYWQQIAPLLTPEQQRQARQVWVDTLRPKPKGDGGNG
jgi:hypothetical protein